MTLSRPARTLVPAAVLAIGLLTVTACSAVPEGVDEAGRAFGVELNPERKDADSLLPGECFIEPEADELIGVSMVGCGEEHDNEVLHVVTVPVSVEYPGDDPENWWEHEQVCAGQVFEDYVDEVWEDSPDWNFYSLLPSEYSWASGERRVHCVLYRMDGTSWTGSPSTGNTQLVSG
ncbi:septum formation family protein [Citricoccus alkalitolerans]|uniref:Septum formation family protein n=1 Tax=Citricoccus alkalitolerans TaxID=246603 RepID=A0ABV8XX84_9MICC